MMSLLLRQPLRFVKGFGDSRTDERYKLGLYVCEHWALGIGHWASGIGHRASGIGHWASGIVTIYMGYLG
ncbi:MAG: hypothetical protein EAZ09_01795 [Oscillatoriales cyanobacterium]|nr:MAG: hypothetical protein EAZ18_23805 [Oscillatoriales cyanobacterium]TAH25674.1 MAG: hypothetical protein EAZ09_01795 [Oscillatoriales cyanobacterium]